MSERKFLIEENQKIWDDFYSQNLETWILENKDKLEIQKWTDAEKIAESKKLLSYNMPLVKVTPYKVAYIKKKQSLQQYKPMLFKFEDYVKKSFNSVTGIDIEEFKNIIEKKNRINIFNAFMVYCVSNGIICNKNKDFLINLLPVAYKKIGMLLVDCS